MDLYSVCSEGRPGSSSIHTVFTITRKSSMSDFQGYNLQATMTKGWYRSYNYLDDMLVMGQWESFLVMEEFRKAKGPGVRVLTARSADCRHVHALMRMRVQYNGVLTARAVLTGCTNLGQYCRSTILRNHCTSTLQAQRIKIKMAILSKLRNVTRRKEEERRSRKMNNPGFGQLSGIALANIFVHSIGPSS